MSTSAIARTLRRANSAATARPMPLAAPVITATFPAISIIPLARIAALQHPNRFGEGCHGKKGERGSKIGTRCGDASRRAGTPRAGAPTSRDYPGSSRGRDRRHRCGKLPRPRPLEAEPARAPARAEALCVRHEGRRRRLPLRWRGVARPKWRRPHFSPGPRLQELRVYCAATPSAASVERSSSPVCGKLDACWNLRTASSVAGPHRPSTAPALYPLSFRAC